MWVGTTFPFPHMKCSKNNNYLVRERAENHALFIPRQIMKTLFGIETRNRRLVAQKETINFATRRDYRKRKDANKMYSQNVDADVALR